MEKQIALVDKITNRVKSILVVDNLENDFIQAWANESTFVVPLIDTVAYVHGIYDGANFTTPEPEYLIQLGVLKNDDETKQTETAAQRQALLEKLGITEEEAQLLLGGN